MQLFIGLGNPGDEYAGTRHSIGREILIAAHKRFGLPPFKPDPNLKSLVSEGSIGKGRVVLVLPETFVNKSGGAALPALRRFKAKARELTIVHDDVDLILGAAKLSFGRGSAGHKGVESVMRALKTRDFWRMRIGVQKKRRVPGEDLVLQKFRGDELVLKKRVIKKSLAAIEAIAVAGPEYAMNAYNR
ncbi:MAG: aminoacyl-tRNA hydrolase [Candidatus Sungbacteria bacterium]|uniref:Aminoacyl-tRNA hydrolase n=1 Tax=Candidatus Sungiibacteriota bacterium TaxID=2750080 RepID=A0A933DTL6_9BACT|nr:aminoacyl-tRNA hydrolase [Candidatus Sungbacteria bacterium]